MAAIADLEVWLTGTRAQIEAARKALSSTGRTAYESSTHRLAGVDAGRHRQYVRIVATATTKTTPGAEGVASWQPAA